MRITALLSTLGFALFVAAGSAQAVDFSFQVVSGSLDPGSDVPLDLLFDSETENLPAWFLKVAHPGNTATTVDQEAFISLGGALATPLGSPVANSIDGGDSSGQWAFIIQPPNSFPPGTSAKFGTISFEDLQEGDIEFAIAPGGAVGGPEGQDLVAAGLVTFEVITVPEPSAALLGAASIGVIGLVARSRRQS